MDRVGEQRDGAADHDHPELQERRQQQGEQADLQCADTLATGLESVVDGVGRVVRMRHEKVVEEPEEARRMRVVGWMVVVVRVPVVVRVVVLVLVRILVLVRMRRVVVLALGAAHAVASARAWWCRGFWSSACSAWKIASDTSWRACSFARR